MSLPITAIQIQMMQEAFARSTEEFRTKFLLYYDGWILKLLQRKVCLRRPHTDDMFQMLFDLGIEPPDYSMNLDKVTIRLK